MPTRLPPSDTSTRPPRTYEAAPGSRMYSELSPVSAYTLELGNVTPFATPLVGMIDVCDCALTIATLSSVVATATADHAAEVLVDLMTFGLW